MYDEGDSGISLNPTATRRSVLASTAGGLVASTLHSTAVSAQQNGRKLWHFQMLGGATSPTVIDRTAFAGGSSRDLHAIDVENGSEQWVFKTTRGFRAPPTVVDGIVFAGCEDGNLYAVDADTGEEQWTFETEGPIQSSPTVVGTTVYVASTDQTIYALDAESGSEQWVFETRGAASSPTVIDDTVFISSDKVYALNATDGSLRWNVRVSGTSSPTVANGTVFVGGLDNKLHGIEAESGIHFWRFETNGAIHSSPTVTGGTVFVGCDDANLYAVDVESKEQQWAFQTGGRIWSSPTAVNNTVFIASRDESIYAIDAEAGTEEWAFNLGGNSNASPIVVDGTVFVGGPLLYALDADVDGSSNGSRVMLGTLNHHSNWRHAGQSIDISPQLTEQLLDGVSGIPLQLMGGTALLTGTLAVGVGVKKWRHKQSSNEMPKQSIQNEIPESVPSPPQYKLEYKNITKKGTVGAGGNADVYGATTETADGTLTFALKEPRLNGTISSDRVDRLLSEAETWANLDDHDHIVSIIDYGSDPLPWIAMEYMDGGHLGARANEFGTEQSLWIALAVTRGVHHAHRRGIAHLDLKPENILFRSVNNKWDVPKIADWGLSKHLLEHSHSREGLSPHYAAPEQFDEQVGPTDERTDIYQLGAVLYGLFTGQPPFKGSTASVMQNILTSKPKPPTRLNESLPSELDDIILKAMKKERADRYESIIYFRDALDTLTDKHSLR
jgi:outer membrane protein assembly factor BamB